LLLALAVSILWVPDRQLDRLATVARCWWRTWCWWTF